MAGVNCRKGRRRKAAGLNQAQAIEKEIDGLKGQPVVQLRAAWARRFGDEAPSIRSGDILARMLAWRIQEEAYGGVDVKTKRQLNHIAEALERDGNYEPQVRKDVATGVVLAREWKGVSHRVTVMADGFLYQGKTYRSLSDVARTITGTRWSGPRFFGLDGKAGPATQEKTA